MAKEKLIFVYTSLWDKNGNGYSGISTLIAFDNFSAALNMMLHEMNYIENKYNGTIHSFNDGKNTGNHADVTLNIWDVESGRYIRWIGEVHPTFVFNKPNIRQTISGVSGLEYDEQDLIDYVQGYLTDRDFTSRDIRRAWNIMGRNRVPLYYADSNLFETIQDAINDFCADYDIEQTEEDYIDPEEVFNEIEL